MDVHAIKESIVLKSKDIGFGDVGFASTKPFDDTLFHYKSRMKRGMSCELESRDNPDVMADVTLFYEEAKTIVVVLEPYRPYEHIKKVGYGWIASGAAEVDYHVVVHKKLVELSEHLLSNYDIHSKAVVDTSPLSDRAMAIRAGLGIIRRNGMFYHNKFGSYCYIGALLIDMDLSGEEKISPKDPCGRCRKCVEFCPGNAISGNYEINSNFCISYLTQKKQLEPVEEPLIGNYVYGCDICQSVCPANRGIDYKKNESFVSHSVSIDDMLEISNRAFKESYHLSTCGWRGKKMLQRNGLIVLGNQHDKSNDKIIAQSLEDDRVAIREVAKRAMDKLTQE